MTLLTDIWQFLLARRLWPVAVLLLAAIVALPMVLAQSPAPAPAPPAAVESARSTLTTEPIVAPAGPGDRARRRHVLGARKNPFKPQVTPTPSATPAPVTAAAPKPGSGGTTPGTGGSTPATGPAATTPVTPVPPPTKKTYELFELSVRFGPSEAEQNPRRDVKRLQALPSSEEPVLIYLGLLKDNKTAVFMVDSGVVAQGDGKCRPSRTTCETIQLKAGETEFFDVVADPADSVEEAEPTASVQYQLDVVKIRKTTTSSAKTANRSLARVSESGRKILRARIAGDGPLRYRYDAKTGRLENLSHKAYKAIVAKAARAARAHF
jgi:hypothetical protein